MKMVKTIKLMILIAAMLSLAACSSVVEVLDIEKEASLTLVADPQINPDESGVSAPVIVRLYELKSDKAFEKANFVDLFENDTEVLGDSLINVQRLKHLMPNEQRKDKLELSQDTLFIGLFAEFSKYDDAKYKIVIPVSKHQMLTASAKVYLSENRMMFVK